MSNANDIPDPLLERFDFALALAAEQEQHREQTRQSLLLFVEVMDSFDRFFACTATDAEHPADPTVKLIAKQLRDALGRAGVERTLSAGKPAEPGQHEILGVRRAEGVAEDIIIEEILCGYQWDGEILRKARVIVAANVDAERED